MERFEIIARKFIIKATNIKGELRTFEVFVPEGARWVKPVWQYDKDGEPINVRLVKEA